MAKSTLPQKTMTPKQRQHALDDLDISQVMIAKACNVTPPAVSLIINNKANSHNIKRYIAAKLCLPMEKVWGVTQKKHTATNPLHAST